MSPDPPASQPPVSRSTPVSESSPLGRPDPPTPAAPGGDLAAPDGLPETAKDEEEQLVQVGEQRSRGKRENREHEQ